MRMHRAYETSLVDRKLLDISRKVSIAVQTDSVQVSNSYTMVDTTTASYINIGSAAKRRALHWISSDGNTPYENNSTIEMPLIRVPFSKHYCFVYNTDYFKSNWHFCLINEIIHTESLFTHGVGIRNRSICCEKHLNKNEFKANAITSIKKNKSNMNILSRDELLNSLDDLNIANRQRQSMLDEANRRSPITFDDFYHLTEEQRFILMGVTKK